MLAPVIGYGAKNIWFDRYMFIGGWEGDGTTLAKRYDQLPTSTVNSVKASGIPDFDERDSAAAKNESRKLDLTLVIATPGQPMAEVVKYAMLHDIQCRASVAAIEPRNRLDCIANTPTLRCAVAIIRIELSEGDDAATPLSLWSTDRQVKGKQGTWTCLIANNRRVH